MADPPRTSMISDERVKENREDTSFAWRKEGAIPRDREVQMSRRRCHCLSESEELYM